MPNIEFFLPLNSNVKLTVYNLMGQQVATLIDERLTAGIYKIQWDASNLPSGVYFYRLTTGSSVRTKKLTLLR